MFSARLWRIVGFGMFAVLIFFPGFFMKNDTPSYIRNLIAAVIVGVGLIIIAVADIGGDIISKLEEIKKKDSTTVREAEQVAR